MEFLSVIIPVYNEEKRISNLENIFSYLNRQKYSSEIILVNDGSTDSTLEMVKKIKYKNFRLISYSPNKGKGAAVKVGMLAAKGSHRLFMDIDLSTPIDQLANFIPYLKQSDVIIGTRKVGQSLLLVRQPLLREYMGKAFTILSRLFLGVNVSDFTCGFKCFSATAAKKIFKLSQITRWGFDSEILFLSHKHKFKITEIPVNWKNDPNSKVKLPQDIVNSLKDLISIRWNNLLGKYN